MQNLRHLIGVKLLKLGSRLLFDSESQKEKFKHSINHDSYIGAMAGSGGHILGEVKPMCEFDTDSVINVLKHEMMLGAEINVTKQEFYYKENWS